MAFQPTIVEYTKGTYIYNEGEAADTFFIIREGDVGIVRKAKDIDQWKKVRLSTGDFFGAESSLPGRSRVDSAGALSNVKLIPVQKNQFEDFIAFNKSVPMKILSEFSTLVRTLNETLTPSGGILSTAFSPQTAEYIPPSNQYEQRGNTRIYQPNMVIFQQGAPGTELFIIQKGLVKITRKVKGEEVTLAYLKAGEIFGEMGMLQAQPRSANAIAAGECEITAIDKENFAQIIEQPKIVQKLALMLADRVWFLFKQLSNQKITNPSERIVDMLVVNLQKEGIEASIKGHTFKFTILQLLEMAGMSKKDGMSAFNELLQSGLIQIEGGYVRVLSITEIMRQNEIFWKLYR